MAQSESGSDWNGGHMSNAELEAFENALSELGVRVSEFLADGTDRTPEGIEATVREYDMPDPLEDRPVDEE